MGVFPLKKDERTIGHASAERRRKAHAPLGVDLKFVSA